MVVFYLLLIISVFMAIVITIYSLLVIVSKLLGCPLSLYWPADVVDDRVMRKSMNCKADSPPQITQEEKEAREWKAFDTRGRDDEFDQLKKRLDALGI